MARLVLTLVGADRAGLVAAVADAVAAHDGNWEDSALTELAGAFAGVALVTVPDGRADDLAAALAGLDGLAIVTHPGGDAAPAGHVVELTVLGNDRPGIVRDVAGALQNAGASIERMSTQVRDAAMYGGRLFEASVTARVAEAADAGALRTALERLAAEIQVDLTVDA